MFFVWNFCLTHLTAGKIAISLGWKKRNFDTVFTKSVSNQTLKKEITEVPSTIWEGSMRKIETVKKINPWSQFFKFVEKKSLNYCVILAQLFFEKCCDTGVKLTFNKLCLKFSCFKVWVGGVSNPTKKSSCGGDKFLDNFNERSC